MTEKEKMLAGIPYDPSDKELTELRVRAHKLSKNYSDTYEDEFDKRNEILDILMPNRGKETFLQGPVFFDYGVFTDVGENFYANFNFTVLDCCRVTIGDNVFCGPNVTLAAPMHFFDAEERRMRTRADGTSYDIEYARPITIGNDCWLASNAVVCGGVTIGDGCIIGAGSVVTRNIPPNSLAAGNPCRVIRKITEKDKMNY